MSEKGEIKDNKGKDERGRFLEGNGYHRPLLFSNEEELQEKIDAYFENCDETIVKRIVSKKGDLIAEISKPYSITGLASWLGTSRETLINYEKRERFFDTIKKAKSIIEANYEERALIGDNNPTFSIFTLKNNYKWKDQSQLDVNSNLNSVKVEIVNQKNEPKSEINLGNDGEPEQHSENND